MTETLAAYDDTLGIIFYYRLSKEAVTLEPALLSDCYALISLGLTAVDLALDLCFTDFFPPIIF